MSKKLPPELILSLLPLQFFLFMICYKRPDRGRVSHEIVRLSSYHEGEEGRAGKIQLGLRLLRSHVPP